MPIQFLLVILSATIHDPSNQLCSSELTSSATVTSKFMYTWCTHAGRLVKPWTNFVYDMNNFSLLERLLVPLHSFINYTYDCFNLSRLCGTVYLRLNCDFLFIL